MRSVSLALLLALTACGSGTTTTFDESDASTSKPDGGDAGSPVTCTAGKVTFAVTVEGAFCETPCSGSVLTILDAAGNTVALDDSCSINCSTCSARACGGQCAAPTKAPSSITAAWDGTYFAKVTDVCGSTSTCFQTQCAVAGHYTAHLCLAADLADAGAADGGVSGICDSAGTPTCTDVAFDWPTTQTLSATIGP